MKRTFGRAARAAIAGVPGAPAVKPVLFGGVMLKSVVGVCSGLAAPLRGSPAVVRRRGLPALDFVWDSVWDSGVDS